MHHTFLLVIAVSLWTVGLSLATRKGEVLYGTKKSLEKTLGPYWYQPILGCPYCMPSFHGLVTCLMYHLYNYYFFHFYPSWPWAVVQWIFIVPAASAINYILINLIRILLSLAEAYDSEDQPSDGCPEVKDVQFTINSNPD